MIKKLLIIGMISVLSTVSLAACGADDTSAKEKVEELFEIKEQPDPIIQNPQKIYPEERLQNDRVVSNSNITKFVEDYNSKVSDDAKLSYDAIRYDETNHVYYVFDNAKNAGLRFRIGDFGQILSAIPYSSVGDTGFNLIDMSTACLNTFGYSGMSDADKKNLDNIKERFLTASANIRDKISLFGGDLSLDAAKNGSLAEIEIPSPSVSEQEASSSSENDEKIEK